MKKKSAKQAPLTLPLPDFSNAINRIYPGYNFQDWQTKPEWKLWCAAYHSAFHMASYEMALMAKPWSHHEIK